MNEKEKPKDGKGAPGLRSKGFYAALYSCVGVMLVLAVVIGYNNFGPGSNKDADIGDNPDNLVEGILDPDLGSSFNLGQTGDLDPNAGLDIGFDTGFSEESQEVSQRGDESYQSQTVTDGDTGDQDAYSPPDGYQSTQADTGQQLWQEPDLDWVAGDVWDDDLQAWKRATPTPAPTETPPKEAAYQPFNEATDYMAWPLIGDVVMAYSADHLIYDKTLEQYRTNKNICIGAQEGTPVTSAAPGVVKEIYQTRESGRTVVVDHGNGWTTTYSQLQDNVLVKTGDVVFAGQQIGAVGTPTMFSSKLGAHLTYAVYKDDSAVDPSAVTK